MAEKFDVYYDKLVELVKPLREWFDIDKVKTYSVFVWTKDSLKNDGFNCFDINYNRIIFYDDYTEDDIPQEAKPIIANIQKQLKYGKDIGIYISR